MMSDQQGQKVVWNYSSQKNMPLSYDLNLWNRGEIMKTTFEGNSRSESGNKTFGNQK